MIEAVENHMPQVIVIDEIGTELEAQAARTIAERGVQLIGTAHGNNLDNLMLNPTLSDLIGGIQSVTLGDEEARRRRTQKSVLERKAPPTFDVIVEIQDRERVMVHADVSETVDAMLRGDPVAPEQRWKDEAGVHKSQSRPRPVAARAAGPRAVLRARRLRRRRLAPRARLARHQRLPHHALGSGGRRTGPATGPAPRAAGASRAAGPARRAAGRCPASGSPASTIAADRSGARRPGSAADGNRRAGRLTRRRVPRGRLAQRAAAEAPFVAGEIADRGPVERAAAAETALGGARARGPRVGAPAAVARPGVAGARGVQGGGGDRPAPNAGATSSPTTSAWPTGPIAAAVDEDGPALRRGERASCRPCGSTPTGSAASAWSRRSRSSSCRSSSPASSTRPTSS